jgi:hypothetical protein
MTWVWFVFNLYLFEVPKGLTHTDDDGTKKWAGTKCSGPWFLLLNVDSFQGKRGARDVDGDTTLEMFL